MTLKVQKWGNSLAIRIPKSVAHDAHLSDGSTVEVTNDGDAIIVRQTTRRKYSLKELLSKVTPENIHGEVDFGRSVGKERFWEDTE